MLFRLLAVWLMATAPLACWAADDAPTAEIEQDAQATELDAGVDSHAGQDDHGDPHADGDHAAGHSGGGGPLAVDPDLALFSLIVFGLLAAILRFTAWAPIVEGLAAREQGIANDIAAASAKHDEAKAELAKYEAKVAAAAAEVKEMLDEARRDAEATKTSIVADGQAAAKAEFDRAIRDVEQARDSAVKQLAEQSANLSIDLAKKVIQQEITPQRQGELVNEALGRIASAPSSN